MKDYTKLLPQHIERMIGENDLFLEVFEGEREFGVSEQRPPLLFVHGAFTGSWMWSKYIPHFIKAGWKCYAMNMRSHYRSRSMDLTRVSFEDYVEDIKENIALAGSECGVPPIMIGFSLGGILCQKIAETEQISGLILIDSSISKEVNEIAPYESPADNTLGMIVPAPTREETFSKDESEEDILFQRKYLSMESSKAILTCACWLSGIAGVSIDGKRITCPALVIKAINNEEDDRRGRAEAEHLHAEYTGLWNTTHTGLLVGQRYKEVVDRMLEWLR